jgi:hypothetical protein
MTELPDVALSNRSQTGEMKESIWRRGRTDRGGALYCCWSLAPSGQAGTVEPLAQNLLVARYSTKRSLRMRKLLLIGLCAILLGTAAPALANSPSQGAYGGTGNNQLSQVQGNTASRSNASATSSLPFTGLNVPVIAGIAVLLAGAGLALRIKTSSDS